MNKKLLAAAVAAAVVAAPAAFADAVVYGKIHNSLDMNDSSVANSDNWTVESRASRLGFKGSEDLGNGLKAIYQIELGVNTDGGNGQAAGGTFGNRTRNTFVGLAGGWGTLVVGRHDTPAKMAFYAAGNELIGDSAIDLNSGTMGVFTEVRANNAIAYVSPNFSGFSFAAAVVPGEETGGGNASDGIADHMSLGLMYKGGGLKVALGYEELDNQAGGAAPTAVNVDREMWQLGASYTMGMFTVGAHYESTDNAGFVSGTDYTAWALTGKAKFGNSSVMLVYTDSESDPSAGLSTETDGWGLAGQHNLSKRTKVYAAYATQDVDAAGVSSDADTFSLGVIHDF